MGLLLVIVVAVVVVFFGYPLLQEDVSSECSAFEKRIIALSSTDRSQAAGLNLLQGAVSGGTFAAAYTRDKYPDLPPSVACAMLYWKLAFSRGSGDSVAPAPTRTPTPSTATDAEEKARRYLSPPSAPTYRPTTQPRIGPAYPGEKPIN